jgi:hypothetical protein
MELATFLLFSCNTCRSNHEREPRRLAEVVERDLPFTTLSQGVPGGAAWGMQASIPHHPLVNEETAPIKELVAGFCKT